MRIAVSPTTVTVAAGDTQQFTATVTGTTNTAVAWSVNGIEGGDASLGTITASGFYLAPSALPSTNPVTVTATSQANAAKSASASVTITPKLAWLDPIVAVHNSPAFTLTVHGRGFTTASQVVFRGAPKATSLLDPTTLFADIFPADIAAPGIFDVTVQDGALTSSPASFYVVPALSRRSVPVVAGMETEGRNMDLLPVDSPSLSLIAVGIGDTAGSTGVVLARDSEAQLLLVGKGILPGTYYMIGNDTGSLSVRQPLAAEFTQTTDGTPAVRLRVSVSPTAGPGPQNIIVWNAAGELAAFVGGVSIAE